MLTDSDVITDFIANDTNDLFNFKDKITGLTGNDNTKDIEMIVQVKYLSKFWKTLEMQLMNWELILF